jgi:hypothetical protein
LGGANLGEIYQSLLHAGVVREMTLGRPNSAYRSQFGHDRLTIGGPGVPILNWQAYQLMMHEEMLRLMAVVQASLASVEVGLMSKSATTLGGPPNRWTVSRDGLLADVKGIRATLESRMMPITSQLLASATPSQAPKPRPGFHVAETSRSFLDQKEAGGERVWRSEALFRNIHNPKTKVGPVDEGAKSL